MRRIGNLSHASAIALALILGLGASKSRSEDPARVHRPDVRVGDSWTFSVRDLGPNFRHPRDRDTRVEVVEVLEVTDDVIQAAESSSGQRTTVVFGRNWDLRER